ncbi:MAG: effector binding domain-containing protein [Anaerolineales bacterium]|nr:effector binding domain-containing protein [Anaerolineales bacterium]
MLQIGEFSKIANISIKTLRFYDQMGLLIPAFVNQHNGYRYYKLEQLPILNKILALRDLGFSLEDIKRLTQDNISLDILREMLIFRQSEESQRIKEQEARLKRVAERIRYLEEYGTSPLIEIAIKEIEEINYIQTTKEDIQELFIADQWVEMKESLNGFLREKQLKACLPWFSIRDINEDYSDGESQVIAAVRVDAAYSELIKMRMERSFVPGHIRSFDETASVIFSGDQNRQIIYSHLFFWIKGNGYRFVGKCRELYLDDSIPIDNPTQVIELQCPIEQVRLPKTILPFQNWKGENEKMEPQIKSKPAFKVAGLEYYGKNENNEVSKLWQNEFISRINEPKRLNFSESFGICSPADPETGEFSYIACVEVADNQEVPQGMTYKEFDEHKYLVFVHTGTLETLGETYKYIYDTWFPQSEYNLEDVLFDMEYYSEEFIPNSEHSKLYLYIAIRE